MDPEIQPMAYKTGDEKQPTGYVVDPDVLANQKAIEDYLMATNRQESFSDEQLDELVGELESQPNEATTREHLCLRAIANEDLCARAIRQLRERASLLESGREEARKYAESIRRDRDTLRAQLFADSEARKRSESEVAALRSQLERAREALGEATALMTGMAQTKDRQLNATTAVQMRQTARDWLAALGASKKGEEE